MVPAGADPPGLCVSVASRISNPCAPNEPNFRQRVPLRGGLPAGRLWIVGQGRTLIAENEPNFGNAEMSVRLFRRKGYAEKSGFGA